jgi:quercetin dioxygenase-like cupin family protein
MSKVNFRFISYDEKIDDIIKQLNQYQQLWKMVADMPREIIGGLADPPGFLPLTMGVIMNSGDNITASELQQNTPAWDVFTSVHEFWKKHGIQNTARAAFFRLAVGGSVPNHIDEGTYYLTKDRYHLSLQGEYDYTCNGETHRIKPGMFFWFDNKDYHDAKVIGDKERITLVFDVPHSTNNP